MSLCLLSVYVQLQSHLHKHTIFIFWELQNGLNTFVSGMAFHIFVVYLFERLTTIYSIEKFVIANKNIGILLPIISVDISFSIKS